MKKRKKIPRLTPEEKAAQQERHEALERHIERIKAELAAKRKLA